MLDESKPRITASLEPDVFRRIENIRKCSGLNMGQVISLMVRAQERCLGVADKAEVFLRQIRGELMDSEARITELEYGLARCIHLVRTEGGLLPLGNEIPDFLPPEYRNCPDEYEAEIELAEARARDERVS